MKAFIRSLFGLLARLILRRYRPLVIGIAGSVGKTATKEAVAAGLDTAARPVRRTVGSFNAEIGVPTTIINGQGPAGSVLGWLKIFWQGLRLLIVPTFYPPALVLEMGADHPGDMERLLRVVQPKVGVLTSVAPEHLEFFGDEESVAAEESLIVRRVPADGAAIVNLDDRRAAEIVSGLHGRVIGYGWSAEATVRAEGYSLTKNERGWPDGMVVKVAVNGSVIPVALPGVIGRHQIYPVLAAVAAGLALGDEVISVIQRLSTYQPPPGRMRLFAGAEGSLLIDDSYNASPAAVQAALTTLAELDVPGRRIAILGQMSELGAAAAEWHDRIGRELAGQSIDRLITVGPLAERIGTAAVAAGQPADRVNNVASAEAAAALILPDLGPGDVVLLKGSRFAARLERAVKILLADPRRDADQLVHSDD